MMERLTDEQLTAELEGRIALRDSYIKHGYHGTAAAYDATIMALAELQERRMSAPQLTQPAVVPPEYATPARADNEWQNGYCIGWNACRAAMLQGTEKAKLPTTIQTAPAVDSLQKKDEAPTTIKPVADLYEVTVPSGRSTTFTKDAAEAKDCADMGWKVQEYVTLERYQAAMLQGAEPVQANTLRDGYCTMPMKLTAENGAKGALSGEFSETKFINCPECFGDDECETCDGSGRIEISVPVSWTTIKQIWAKGVEHFAAAPQQEAE